MTTPINMLAIDLAKGSFQVCAIGQDGAVLYNRVLSRTRLAALLAEQQSCIVAMEACATSHYWGRVAQSHGHEVRLGPAPVLFRSGAHVRRPPVRRPRVISSRGLSVCVAGCRSR
jgi:transposase